MDIVSVRIKFSYWESNNTDIFRVDEKLVYEELFEIDMEITKFERKLYELIMNNKNDGMALEVNSTEGLHFIEIDLFLDKSEVDYDINYIVDFLRQYKKTDKIPCTKDLSEYQGFIYIKNPNVLEELIDSLKCCDLNPKKIGRTTFIYERGASDLWQSYIIGIASSVSIEFIKSTVNKFLKKFGNNNRDLRFGIFNAQKLKEHIKIFLGENEQNLEMIYFENIGEGRYFVIFTTRYRKIFVETDNSGNIHKINVERKTQTKI